MKIRKGFVSNSSSSSFVIGIKDHKGVKEALEQFKISEENLFSDLIDDLIDWLAKHAYEMSEEEYIEETGYQSVDQMREEEDVFCCEVIEMFQDGFKIYNGETSNEDGSTVSTLYSMCLSFKSKNLVIKERGGG